MVIESLALEDELGDVVEKAMRCAHLTLPELAARSGIDVSRLHDVLDYRYELSPQEIHALASALGLNPAGFAALANGNYPLPSISSLPCCLYPLRFPHGIGLANAYIAADCSAASGLLFDTGADFNQLRRLWPRGIKNLQAVFLTHVESEHTGGLAECRQRFPDTPVFGPPGTSLPGVTALAEGARLVFGGFEVEALNTPGHAEAHNAYLVRVPRARAAPPLLLGGDLIFAGSLGGAYCCPRQLLGHVHRLLDHLPADTVIAPGHGPLTTIGHERTHNPFAPLPTPPA